MDGETEVSRDARAVSAPEQVYLHGRSSVSGVYSFPVLMIEKRTPRRWSLKSSCHTNQNRGLLSMVATYLLTYLSFCSNNFGTHHWDFPLRCTRHLMLDRSGVSHTLGQLRKTSVGDPSFNSHSFNFRHGPDSWLNAFLP